jgi:hypothetical protein
MNRANKTQASTLPPDRHSPHKRGRAESIIGAQRIGRKIPVKESGSRLLTSCSTDRQPDVTEMAAPHAERGSSSFNIAVR